METTRQQNDRTLAALGKGTWVQAEDMPPEANIANRLYRTEDGRVWRVTGYEPLHAGRIDAWFFPANHPE